MIESKLARVASAAFVAALVAFLAAPALAVGEGDLAPAFEIRALTGGGKVSLADHRGKVVYLDFWASWCPPCRASMPIIDDLTREFSKDQFSVVAVNLDKDRARALEALKKTPVSYPSAADPDGRLPEAYSVGTMPTSYLIDRAGVVRYVHQGFRRGDEHALRSEIRRLIGGGK